MDNNTLADLNRMIMAIDHECCIKVKEIRLEASEEYNRIKNELITSRKIGLEREFAKETKEIAKRQLREESKLRQHHKLKIEELKAALLEEIVQNVREAVQKLSFDESILQSVLEKISINEIFVFVDQRDIAETKKILSRSNVKYEIKQMPIEGLGGVIVCSKDGREIWDNSFETRINILIETHADKLNTMVFEQ
ncbi:uncharacterized protein VICG_01462 [Vittaforma corneae ATCC 50505]|uniref:V-type proton ATPase subunit E n=1 Tax=Vittaforma corneae (strain ATCC 50505) TaxID=993615 RepID=L2GKR5_VITCO|nr:uncharacterized protein VICG_01462 [Vittaforma corneae ATCC 50505]ELA41478.1 hypothetical protein VICG_01462 [Vittaforma corneae ATCC 50505]